MNIIFMGTARFAVPSLEALAEAGYKIAAVCTQPDRPAGRGQKVAAPPVKQRASDLDLPVLQPATLRSAEVVEELRRLEPELIVAIAYGLLLPPAVLAIPRLGAVNLHPSLLPKYRGAAPINWVLINGETQTGLTTIFMNAAMDAGDIILQMTVPILDDENAGQLEERLSHLGAPLLLQTVDLIAQGGATRTPQDNARATAAPKIAPQHGRIEWGRPAGRINSLIRGLAPRPGAYCLLKGQRLEVLHAEVIDDAVRGEAGTITDADKRRGPVVQAGRGRLLLREVKPQSRKAISGVALINGYRLNPGEKLE